MPSSLGTSTSVPAKRVAVIGAGVSGLVAAKTFQERGHKVTGFERSPDIGGVWELSKCYPGVETQSPKDLYCYTDHPMPDEFPEWPNGNQVHDYLKSYVKKHKLDHVFQLNAIVKSMKRHTEENGWLVRYMDGKLARQPTYDEMQENIKMMLGWKRKERPAAKVYGGLCSAPFHYQHFAELLLDMGCTKRTLMNPFKEYLSYPRAHVYGEFVASAPQYKAVKI